MQPIAFLYKGSRGSFYIFHPAKHGPSYLDGQWERGASEFHRVLNDFCAVADMYSESETRHETVGGSGWKKEILNLFNAIEKDEKKIYVLEALAEAVFDVDNRSAQRMLPYHYELIKRGNEILSDDILPNPKGAIDPTGIVRRSWGS